MNRLRQSQLKINIPFLRNKPSIKDSRWLTYTTPANKQVQRPIQQRDNDLVEEALSLIDAYEKRHEIKLTGDGIFWGTKSMNTYIPVTEMLVPQKTDENTFNFVDRPDELITVDEEDKTLEKIVVEHQEPIKKFSFHRKDYSNTANMTQGLQPSVSMLSVNNHDYMVEQLNSNRELDNVKNKGPHGMINPGNYVDYASGQMIPSTPVNLPNRNEYKQIIENQKRFNRQLGRSSRGNLTRSQSCSRRPSVHDVIFQRPSSRASNIGNISLNNPINYLNSNPINNWNVNQMNIPRRNRPTRSCSIQTRTDYGNISQIQPSTTNIDYGKLPPAIQRTASLTDWHTELHKRTHEQQVLKNLPKSPSIVSIVTKTEHREGDNPPVTHVTRYQMDGRPPLPTNGNRRTARRRTGYPRIRRNPRSSLETSSSSSQTSNATELDALENAFSLSSIN
ncbi:hypothetical protein SNEBB_010124 [Seison nebaliae]|nr:hypothetical protein SNEBB_010124 [Seison nebaliae]